MGITLKVRKLLGSYSSYGALVAMVIRLTPLLKYLQFHDYLTDSKKNAC